MKKLAVKYTPAFLRKLDKLEPGLQEEAIYKIKLFADKKNHEILKVHKLKGRLDNCYSFSVNYKTRIVFSYSSKSKNEAILLAIGDHDIYS